MENITLKVWSSTLAIIWLGNIINAIYVHFWLPRIKKILWIPFPEKYSCDESSPALNHLDYQSGRQRTRLRDRDRLGNDPKWVPIFWVVVPGYSRNSYGTSPNFWVQNKFIKSRQSTQNAWLRPAEIFGKFFSDPLFNFSKNLGDLLLSHSRVKCGLWLTVPSIFWCFSCRNYC